MWPSLGKRTIVIWVFRCNQSFLMLSSYHAWNDHINHLSISSCCVCPCLVTRQMFWSSSLTKHSGLFTHSLTSFICFTPSLVVKGYQCEILVVKPVFFVRYFWKVGTEFLCLANLTFRFVVMRSIRSFATAICSAYKWIHPHLVEFQCTEKFFCQNFLALSQDPLLGSNFTEV